MHFGQHRHAHGDGRGREFTEPHIVQCRDDQKNAIGAEHAPLGDLILIDGEILA